MPAVTQLSAIIRQQQPSSQLLMEISTELFSFRP